MMEKIQLMSGALESEEEALLAITRPSNHLVISGRTSINLQFNEFVLLPEKHFKPWSMAHVYFLPRGGRLFEFDVELGRDRHRVLQSIYGAPDKPHVYIFWGSTKEECGVIANHPCVCTEPTIIAPSTASFVVRMEALVPGYDANYSRRINAKANLFRRLSVEDSLAETEKQVDLLAAMVKELVLRTIPEVERPAWWASFSAVMDAHDSAQHKGREAAIADIASRKGSIRALVAAYQAAREG